MFATVNKLSATEFRRQIAGVDSSGGWPVFVLSNHDIARSYVRYGDGVHNDAIAKFMAALYLTLRGTPILYYGEEIGMTNNDPTRKEDVKDPIGQLGWPKEKGRDGERTPMQWNTSTNAGFSSSKPWLPVPATYKTHNVESESHQAGSILDWYKRLLKLRHTEPALLEGKWIALNETDPNVLAYLRTYKDQTMLVALNMSGTPRTVHFDLPAQELHTKAATVLSTAPATSLSGLELMLEPFGVYIGRLNSGVQSPK